MGDLVNRSFRCLEPILLLVFLAALLVACDGSNTGKSPMPETDKVVAVIGEDTITEKQLRWYLASRNSVSGAGISEQDIHSRLQEMAVVKLLAREARRLKLDEEPPVKYSVDQLLGQRLLEQQVLGPVSKRKIDSKEIEAYYKKHRNEYEHSRQVRLADVFIASSRNDSAGVREKKKNEARLILSEALSAENERFGFSRLVELHSDRHPAYPKGDTGYFDEQGNPQGLDPSLVKAAFSLKKKGMVFDRVVETPDGFHIIMLVGERPPRKTELGAAASRIEQRIRKEEIKEKREKLIDLLQQKSKLDIDADILGQILEDYKAAREKSHTAPGQNSGPPTVYRGKAGS